VAALGGAVKAQRLGDRDDVLELAKGEIERANHEWPNLSH
jgi:hypothetical protein